MLATYVHHMDPVLFRLPIEFSLGPINVDHPAIRWYGLAYLAGFIVGYFLLVFLSGRGRFPLEKAKIADFLTYAAVFGVFLGGRLGYFLLYWLPANGFDAWLSDPLVVLRVWEGGMASHGGILGLILYTAWYARKHQVSWFGIGDGLCVVAPLGVFFGRMANFINGELYGRPAPEDAWAMKFPTEMMEREFGSESWTLARDAAFEVDPSLRDKMLEEGAMPVQVLIDASRDSPEIREAIAPHLTARYPSQIYEGLVEGLLLFLVLFVVRWKFPRMRHGILTGLFFILYAVGRITVESFRQPDAELFELLGGSLTKGQFYSVFMILLGAGFIFAALKEKFQGPEVGKESSSG